MEEHTKTTIHSFIAVLCATAGLIVLLLQTVQAAETITGQGAVQIKEDLTADLSRSLRIQPVQEFYSVDGAVTRRPVPPAANGDYVLHKRSIIGLQPIRGLGPKPSTDVIDISGESDPYTKVRLSIRSVGEPIVIEAEADDSGDWSMSVVVDALPSGNLMAYIQTESRGAFSDELIIAEFTVVDVQEVSNTTWLFLIVAGFGVLFILIGVNIWFLFKRKNRHYTPPPAAQVSDEVATVEESSEDQ